MENKINIAELLKNCPSGMELDCTMYDNLYFNQIYDDGGCIYEIGCYTIVDEIRTTVNFTKFGTFNTHANSKCVIFPKGKTTWEGFVPPCKFNDGDILFVKSVYSWILVYKESKNNEDLYKYVAIQDNHNHTYIVYDNNPLCCKEDVSEIRLATEEEKQKLFDTIKANGYKWNAKTKTLEKLLRFKVGNVIQCMDYKVKITEVNIEDECYEYESIFAKGIGSIEFSEQDNWELIPNKFDINDLKPFDRVLVRYHKNNKWCGSLFSHIDSDFHSHCYKYVTIAGKSYPMCIPYKGNEHLLGETDDCDEYFKIWE